MNEQVVGQGGGNHPVDVGQLSEQVYQVICTDQQLRGRFGLTGRGAAAHLRAANLLHDELGRLIDETLVARGELVGERFSRYLRRRQVIEDDYIRVAHHLLTVALAHRVGPDNLVRIGAVLADIWVRMGSTDAGPAGSAARTAGSSHPWTG